MNAGQKSVRRLVAANATARDTICSSCLFRLSQHGFKPDLSQYWGITARYYASAATAEAAINPTQQSPQHDPQIPPVTASATRKAYRLSASPVLSRPPLLTRDLTSFEKAYYFYQKRLNERLALPFTRYFYIKKGTPADVEWKRKRAIRKTAGKDIGIYSGYGEEAWNDEVLVGDRLGEREAIQEALIRDAEGKDIVEASKVSDGDKGGKVSGDSAMGESMRKILQQQQVTVQQPMSRVSEADEKNDRRSLSRKMDRALYLLIQNKYGRWRFPEDRVYGRENLNQAAERILIQSCGINMNTWIVGNHPVGHHSRKYTRPTLATITPNQLVSTSTEEFQQEEHGEKIFFMKGRMMGGQADITKNEYGDKDFLWLAKEEVEEVVDPGYWKSVKGMLTER